MRTRSFGPTGAAVSIIGQGTWKLEQDDRASALAALSRGLDLGMNHIDTAEMYGDGEVEAMIGPLVAERRGEIFLASKEERGIEHAVLPWCEEHGVAVVAYSPLGSGSFPSPRSHGGRVLAEIAAAHGATPRQVALAFIVRRPPLFAIPKAARVEHVEENAAAGDLELSEDEIARIDQAFPRGPRRKGIAVL